MANIRKVANADGSTVYRVQVRLKGQPPQYASFRRLTDARNWIQATETAMRDGRHIPRRETKRRTVAEALERYEAEVLPEKAPGTQTRQRAQLNWWRGQIGAYTLDRVDPALLSEAKGHLLKLPSPRGGTLSPATVNRYLAVLSHVFTVAAKEWGWVDHNPLSRVSKNREPRGRMRILSERERDRLLEACQAYPNPALYPVVLLALTTGMRHGEIMGLRWPDIDFERRRIVIHHTKNGERRSVHLVGPAFDVLSGYGEARRPDTDLLFPSRLDPSKPLDLRAPWETVLGQAGIDGFRFHDLRHSAASYLAMSGATLAEIAEILGHKTLAMVKRYAHLTEGHTASVVERMADKYLS